jgi:DNA-binding response OmpR family regulator
MSVTMDHGQTSAVNQLLGWYGRNAERLQKLADARQMTVDELMVWILDEATMQNALRLAGPDSFYQIQDIEIDLNSRTVRKDGEFLRLSRLQFDMLAYLARNAGVVIRRHQMANEVWGGIAVAQVGKTMDMHCSTLRGVIGDRPDHSVPGVWKYITTLRGVGWRMEKRPYGRLGSVS